MVLSTVNVKFGLDAGKNESRAEQRPFDTQAFELQIDIGEFSQMLADVQCPAGVREPSVIRPGDRGVAHRTFDGGCSGQAKAVQVRRYPLERRAGWLDDVVKSRPAYRARHGCEKAVRENDQNDKTRQHRQRDQRQQDNQCV